MFMQYEKRKLIAYAGNEGPDQTARSLIRAYVARLQSQFMLKRFWLDHADAQADQSLRCSCTAKGPFLTLRTICILS